MKSKPARHDCEACESATADDFLDYAEFKGLMKDLDAAARTMQFAAHSVTTLADKLPLHRAQEAIESARAILRPHVFVYGDAARIAFRACED